MGVLILKCTFIRHSIPSCLKAATLCSRQTNSHDLLLSWVKGVYTSLWQPQSNAGWKWFKYGSNGPLSLFRCFVEQLLYCWEQICSNLANFVTSMQWPITAWRWACLSNCRLWEGLKNVFLCRKGLGTGGLWGDTVQPSTKRFFLSILMPLINFSHWMY